MVSQYCFLRLAGMKILNTAFASRSTSWSWKAYHLSGRSGYVRKGK